MTKFLTLFLSVITLGVMAQQASVEVHSIDSNSMHFTFTNGEIKFSTVEKETMLFTQIQIEGLTKSYDIGKPELPVYSKLIEVPAEGDISFEILQDEEVMLDLSRVGYHYEIIPSQRSVFKNEDLNKVKFLYDDDVYTTGAFYRQKLVSIERLGTMRGKHIARLQIAPFAYHPLTNEIKSIEHLEVRLIFSSSISEVPASHQSVPFESTFTKLLNHHSTFKNEFVSSPIRMVVLSDPMFEETLQEYISWKKRIGFDIIEVYKGEDELGTTAASMKSYIQGLYDNATDEEPAPTYLLIVGDHEQIPSFDVGAHVSDMYYCEFDGGDDYFPEMYVGRFSASSIAELEPQLEKTIQYEGYTMPDPSYLGEALMVSGVDGFFAETHGNGQINYGNSYYFNTEHDINSHTYLYPESSTSESEAAIIEHVSQGVGFANYTAHCSHMGWSDPSFEVSDVASLENEDEYGLMIGNCCQSNTFNGVTCFGEALLRQSKGGAVGYIGGSNNTLWDEDYYWGVGNGPVSAYPTYEETTEGIYDCSFHENGEQEEDWSIAQGQIHHAGNWAVTESASSNTQYYWEIYHLMGDPTVQTYYGIPSTLEVIHPAAVTLGTSSVNVSTEAHTYVAVNQSGILLDASYTDASGNVLLSFDPITNMEPIEIVATKQNRQIYIAEINIMSTDAPFVAFASLEVNDGMEGNSMVENGESFSLDVTLQNYGMVDAESMELVVSCSNSDVVISSENIEIDALLAEGTITLDDVISVDLQGVFEDQESVTLNFTITDEEGNQWVTYGSFVVNAPNIDFTSFVLNDTDANNVIDFGEPVELIIQLENFGNASCLSGVVTVSTEFEFINIDEEEIAFTTIEANGSTGIVIPITLAEDAPAGQYYEISVVAQTDDGYNAVYSIPFSTPNCLDGAMEVQLLLATDYYAEEVAWTMTSADGSILGNAPLGSLNSETNYEEIFCLENNTYLTFEIEDSYGDGLYTDGYSIVVCGQTIASGADYGSGETIYFIAGCDQSLVVGCTDETASNYNPEAEVDDGSCVEVNLEELNMQIHVYPNPAQQYIHIETDDLHVETIAIVQMDGKEVQRVSVFESITKLNVETLETGYYILKVQLENGQELRKSVAIM